MRRGGTSENVQFKPITLDGQDGMIFTMDGDTNLSVNVWKNGKFGSQRTLATKDDLTPDFKNVGSGYGLVAGHAAIGKLHILRLAGNVTSSFSNFDLVLPDSCNGYFIAEYGKIGNISYTIKIDNKHLIITPDTSIAAGTYFVHWLIYYG